VQFSVSTVYEGIKKWISIQVEAKPTSGEKRREEKGYIMLCYVMLSHSATFDANLQTTVFAFSHVDAQDGGEHRYDVLARPDRQGRRDHDLLSPRFENFPLKIVSFIWYLKEFLWFAAFFAAAVVTMASLLSYVYFRIQSVNDPRDVNVKPSDLQDKNPLASMLGVEEPKQEVAESMTVAAYDMLEFKKWMSATFMPFIMVFVMHVYWKFIPPLLLLPSNLLMDSFTNNLTRVYVLGQSDKTHSDLKRPFAKPKGFMDTLNDAKKQAEKASGTAKPERRDIKHANQQAVRKTK
jgi:hypothetical protein